MKKMIIKNIDDFEIVEIYINEECIKALTYDQHGSTGIELGVEIAKKIANHLSIEIEEVEE